MNITTTLLTLSGALAFASSAGAATLVAWDFTGNDPLDHTQATTAVGQSIAAAGTYATPLAGVSATDPTGSPGSGLAFSNGLAAGTPNNANEINIQALPLTLWQMEFSLSATSGTISVTGISMELWRNGGGAPSSMAWELSTDGGSNFTAFGSTSSEANTADGVFRTHSFTGSVTASDIVLRFAPTGMPGTGNVHISDIEVTGTFAPVPEPSSMALLGLGGLALIVRRKK